MNKSLKHAVFALAVTLALNHACGQNFTNLDFESAKNLVPLNDPATNALPGWLAFAGTQQLTTVQYNNGLVIPTVELTGFSSLVPQGDFAVLLSTGASISQTAMVASDALSLLFGALPHISGQTPFTVSLDGQDLSYSEISTAVNSYGQSYGIYGADISPFAGRDETLTILATPGADGGILDDIQFSPMPIPEPGEIAMLACGILGFGFYRRRRFDLRRRER